VHRISHHPIHQSQSKDREITTSTLFLLLSHSWTWQKKNPDGTYSNKPTGY